MAQLQAQLPPKLPGSHSLQGARAAPDRPMCNRLKQAMVRDQEDEEEKVQWRVDAEVRLRTGALQAEAAQAAAQQGSQHSHLQARLCFRCWSLRWDAADVAPHAVR